MPEFMIRVKIPETVSSVKGTPLNVDSIQKICTDKVRNAILHTVGWSYLDQCEIDTVVVPENSTAFPEE